MSIPQKRFLSELLECGVLDIDFFIRLLNKLDDNDIYLDVQEVLQTHGKIHINAFISESLYLLAEKFLQKYQHKIETLLNIQDLERYREENELYEIYVNYLDSHLYFHNEHIQNLFESSEFYYL